MGSALSESGTLVMAYLDTKQNAEKLGISFWNYVRQGYKPSVNVVLLEDIAAVLGVFIAGSCMTLTYMSGNPIYDCVGSLLIGGVMVSFFFQFYFKNKMSRKFVISRGELQASSFIQIRLRLLEGPYQCHE